MKKTLIIAICLFSINGLYAQDFVKNGNYVTVGYGFNPWSVNAVKAYKGYTGYKHFGIGPILVSYERGITDILGIGRIGVGGSVGFSTHSSSWSALSYDIIGNPPVLVASTDEYKYNWTEIAIMAKAAYHFEFDIPKMDVYAGVGLGYNVVIDKYKLNGTVVTNTNSTISRPSPFAHQEFVGIRYYFSDLFGVYAEAGYGQSVINGGAVLSF